MKFLITLETDENGKWIAECPAIPGCISQGDAKDEAVQNIEEAIQLCLEVRKEKNYPLIIETKEIEVVL